MGKNDEIELEIENVAGQTDQAEGEKATLKEPT